MKNIAVFFGGKSVEHDISIITALQAMKAKPSGYNFLPVYITPDGQFVSASNLFDGQTFLDFKSKALNVRQIIIPPASGQIWEFKGKRLKGKINIDCALLCNHGHGGEDGSLQGLLELAEIPYTSTDLSSSALCMDKELTKILLSSASIATPKYECVHMCDYQQGKDKILKRIIDKIGLPLIVKPASLGSSVGINICEDEHKLPPLIEEAFVYDKKVLVEQFVTDAREFCCAILKTGDMHLVSGVSEVKKGKLYTFEEKYLREKEDIKRDLPKTLEKQIKDYALLAYKKLQCAGVVRVDFLYDEKNKKLYVNELNAIPGSLSFNMFDIPFSDLIACLIKEGIKRHEEKNEIVYKFNSDAIQKYIDMTLSFKLK